MKDMKEDSVETIELQMALLVRRVTSVASNRKGGSLDRSAYLLLHQISSQGLAGVKALAEEFQLDISTASRQAGALELKGYVRKVPDPQDGRSYFYQITDSGTQELTAYKQIRLDHITRLVSDWAEEDRQKFGDLLLKFNQSLMKR